MATKASVAEIEAHFSDFVRAAESGNTVLVTRHGKPVVALVPASEVAQLERPRAAGPEKGLISVAGGWEGSEELIERIAEIRRTPPRPDVDLD
jgi:prevent-host-death family protein